MLSPAKKQIFNHFFEIEAFVEIFGFFYRTSSPSRQHIPVTKLQTKVDGIS